MKQKPGFIKCPSGSMEPFKEYEGIIPEFGAFQESLRSPLPVHLRVNRLRIEPGELINSLGDKGIEVRRVLEEDDTIYQAPDLRQPGNLLEYFLGFIHPQALTSCLASKVLDPGEGTFVLDMCAAPGGKTSHMAQLMNNTGLVIANELYPSRHPSLGHTLSRLGVLNTVATAYQAQEFPLRKRFDYILADVPCTGEGRFRSTHQGAAYREGPGRSRLPELQRRIILRGFDLLQQGGVMVYSTCTYNPEENESIVNHLLEHREAELLPIRTGVAQEPGLVSWKGEMYDRQLRRTARFYPHRIDSVGFFMARIGRRG